MQTLYLSPEQTKEILKDTNADCMVQFLHYVAISHQENPIMEDKVLASMLGWSIAKVKKNRLRLTKTGWFLRKRIVKKGDGVYCIYFVGIQAVLQGGGQVFKMRNLK